MKGDKRTVSLTRITGEVGMKTGRLKNIIKLGKLYVFALWLLK